MSYKDYLDYLAQAGLDRKRSLEDRVAELTPRQREVAGRLFLDIVAKGFGNEEGEGDEQEFVGFTDTLDTLLTPIIGIATRKED